MTALEQKIQEASQLYYSTGKSNLSDEEFDLLVEQLRAENPKSDILKKVGWGYSPYADTTPRDKYSHKYGTAGSLEKARTWNELGSTFKETWIDVSAKLDGLSVVLYYKKGHLVQALTRGNGETGIDITDKITAIMDKQIKDSGFTGAVRGEIVMSHSDFKRFQAVSPEAKNPRNSAVGLINSDNPGNFLTFLSVVVYSIVGDENGIHRKAGLSSIESL